MGKYSWTWWCGLILMPYFDIFSHVSIIIFWLAPQVLCCYGRALHFSFLEFYFSGARFSVDISEFRDCRMSNGVWITVFGALPDILSSSWREFDEIHCKWVCVTWPGHRTSSKLARFTMGKHSCTWWCGLILMLYFDIWSHDSIIIFRRASKVLVRCCVDHGRAVGLRFCWFLVFLGDSGVRLSFLFWLLEIAE